MKNLFASFFFVLALATTFAAQAQTIRRVNNTGITGTLIYSDIDAAIVASASGDVIQVEPSGVPYSGFTVDKNVTIVGPGYFLDPSENAGLQANPLPALVGGVLIQTGGASATMTGLTFSGDVRINASNITIQRCRFSRLYIQSNSAPITGLIIKQCYFDYMQNIFGIASDNMLITNCIITNGNAMGFPVYYSGGFFNNVVVTGTPTLNNFVVANNYFSGGLGGGGNTLNNNISATTSFPTTNGNQANVPQSAVFVLAPGATAFDAWYQLKTGTNPARGTGQGGVDVGAFGGVTPYKLGGLPNIPAIYQQTETIVGNSLNATLSTRSNN